jgi:hypothetical protein
LNVKLTTAAPLIAIAVAMSTCQSPAQSGILDSPAADIVILLTATGDGIGCPANLVEGDLVVDEDAGTAILDAGVRKAIRWPFGYLGRRSGSEIEVLDPNRTVIAKTGTRIQLAGGETVPGVWFACPGLPTVE